jgi:cell division inhibitor SepF
MGVLDRFLDAIKLNDEDDDDYLDEDLMDDEEDDFLDDEEESKPKKRFFEKFSGKKADRYDDDDDFGDEIEEPAKPASFKTRKQQEKKAAPAREREPEVRSSRSSDRESSFTPAPKASSKITPMRRRSADPRNMAVCVIKPASMENTREIADTLLENSTVILNLEGIDIDLAQRIIDFASGSCYSLGGTLQKVSSYIFVLGPSSVDITGDLQSILGGSAPSVRAGY